MTRRGRCGGLVDVWPDSDPLRAAHFGNDAVMILSRENEIKPHRRRIGGEKRARRRRKAPFLKAPDPGATSLIDLIDLWRGEVEIIESASTTRLQPCQAIMRSARN